MPSKVTQSKSRVLVTDSEESVCKLLKELLRQQGYIVVSVTDSREVIAKVKEGAYDLMFIGLHIAKKAGLELAKVVKERSPSTSVVIMTGLDAEDIMVEILEAGVDGVLLKPFDIDEALTLVSDLTESKRSTLSKVS